MAEEKAMYQNFYNWAFISLAILLFSCSSTDTNKELYKPKIDTIVKAKYIFEQAKSISGHNILLYTDNTWIYDTATKPEKVKIKKGKPRKVYDVENNNSGMCGAMTKKGTSCRRTVSGGGRCWQH